MPRDRLARRSLARKVATSFSERASRPLNACCSPSATLSCSRSPDWSDPESAGLSANLRLRPEIFSRRLRGVGACRSFRLFQFVSRLGDFGLQLGNPLGKSIDLGLGLPIDLVRFIALHQRFPTLGTGNKSLRSQLCDCRLPVREQRRDLAPQIAGTLEFSDHYGRKGWRQSTRRTGHDRPECVWDLLVLELGQVRSRCLDRRPK